MSVANPVEQIRALGYAVREFTPWHFRVADCIDFWLPRGKWHDLRTGERGHKPLDQIPYLITQRLGEVHSGQKQSTE
jgi:hypothetical protein